MFLRREGPGKRENQDEDQPHNGRHRRADNAAPSPGEEEDPDRRADDAGLQPSLPQVPGRGQRNAVMEAPEQADAAGLFDRFEVAAARGNVRLARVVERPFTIEDLDGLGVSLPTDGGDTGWLESQFS